MIKKFLIFTLGFIITYLIVIFILSQITIKNYTLLQLAISDYVIPHGHGYTTQRFREIENYKDVDILFIGSSHAYRSFDPNVFDRLGLKTFNTGSNSQSPMNTYYLLKYYYKQLKPKIIICEVYPTIFELDGLEGYYELLANREVSNDIINTAIELKSFPAINALIGKFFNSFMHPFDKQVQTEIKSQSYIEGGYVYSKIIYQGDYFGERKDIKINNTQISYLEKIISFTKAHNSKLMLVVAPIPVERKEAISNYEQVVETIGKTAAKHSIPFYDFNQAMNLQTNVDFRDFHHLNANGAKIFSYAISDSLIAVETFNQCLNIEPSLKADSYRGLGMVLMENKRFPDALTALNQALAINPEDTKTLIIRASAFDNLGKYENAIADLKHVGSLPHPPPETYYNLARIYEKANLINDAISSYRTFLKNLPPEYSAYQKAIENKISELQSR